MGGNKEVIDTYGHYARGWKADQVMYDHLEEDLERKIGRSIGFGRLGDKLGKWIKDNEWGDEYGDSKQRWIERHLPQITA